MDMSGIHFIDEVKLSDKRVFIRCDFNVPLDDDGNITDDARIRAAMPSVHRALDEGAVVILASHLGRPKGNANPKLSMVTVGERLSEMLGYEVIVPDDVMDPHVDDLLDNLDTSRQLVLLENLRFHPGEKKNDAEFARRLASLATVYVNDAFGTAHRAHASTYGMVKHFDQRTQVKVAGFLLKKELEQLNALLVQPKQPFVAIMGGAKVSDKLGVLHSLLDRVQHVIIGGAMAYTFLKAQGHNVGTSRVEEDLLDDAKAILTRASQKKVKIHLPQDHVVSRAFDSDDATITPSEQIPYGYMGLDIGPRTRDAYAQVIAGAKTFFWNGPMGVFERDAYNKGTFAIAHAVAENAGAQSVVGGGDSASAARAAGVLDKITHVSTGGGASLEFVEGRALPGVEALRPHHQFNLG